MNSTTVLYKSTTMLYNSPWAWASWIIIGVLAGLMASYFLLGKHNKFFDVLIGLIGAIIGGWGSAMVIRANIPQGFATAAIVALFIAGAALWIYDTILLKLEERE